MILIINNHSELIRDLRKILKKNKVPSILADQRSNLKNIDVSKIKGVILSGGSPNLDMKIDIDDIEADILSLLEFKVPVLGICEGHQIIAQIYGGKINHMKEYFERKNKVSLIKKNKIFVGLPSKVTMFESHGRYVKSIPKDFVLAATSDKNKVEAMFHKTKDIFSVQFHPEYSGSDGEKIIENFLRICKVI